MQTIDLEKLKYPVGKFQAPASFSMEAVKKNISELEKLPAFLEEAMQNISPDQYKFSYRPEGWNIIQIVHHVADSHLNFHIRLRLALAEETPTVKPYDENVWAKFPDANSSNHESSLQILKGVHARAVQLLNTLTEKDFMREYYHPEYKKNFNLFWLLSLYAWHGKHHVEQIKAAAQHKF